MMWTASKLSRGCAHHHILSEISPRPTRDKAAAKGKAFHAALEQWHKAGFVAVADDPDVAVWIATMMEHDWTWPDGAELEVAWGLDPWGKFVPVEETEPHVYRSIAGDDLLTAGRADACWVYGDVLASVDWKTGRTSAPHATENLQVNAAGIALAQKWKVRAYVPTIYYAREGIWQPGDEVEIGSPEWDRMLEEIKTAAALDDQPHPGDHCVDCWERKNCSAA